MKTTLFPNNSAERFEAFHGLSPQDYEEHKACMNALCDEIENSTPDMPAPVSDQFYTDHNGEEQSLSDNFWKPEDWDDWRADDARNDGEE